MSAHKILLGPSKMSDRSIEKLESRGFQVIPNPFGRKLTKEELLELLVDDVDGIVAGLEPLDREVIEKSNLKVISRCGSGINNVDLDAVKDHDVNFYYTPFGPTASVAELTLCNILCLLRNVTVNNANMHNRKWVKTMGNLLQEKTVAILGFGRIGRAVSNLLAPFNVRIIVVDPFATKEELSEGFMKMDLIDALPEADVVCVHVNGSECLFGKDEFAAIKQGAIILNASRGEIVDEAALIEALKSERIAGAWLDVFETEPYDGELCDFDNVILSPHLSSYTLEGREKMESEAVENLIKGFDE